MDVPHVWGHNSETKAQIRKTKNMLTTSFDHSIRRNQHGINLRSHLGWAVSFVLNQLQKYNIRDFLKETNRIKWGSVRTCRAPPVRHEPAPSTLTFQLAPVFSMLRVFLASYLTVMGVLRRPLSVWASSALRSIGDCLLPSLATGNSTCHLSGPAMKKMSEHCHFLDQKFSTSWHYIQCVVKR